MNCLFTGLLELSNIFILNPVPDTLDKTKYSPKLAPWIVIPTEGKKAFNPPRLEVPVKNGFPKVTFSPDADVPEDNGAVDVPDPLT